MTDDKMRQLEAVAQAVLDDKENVGELYDHLGPREVLALIQRVRDAEAAADSAMGDMSADLRDAERRGAEEMREAAATVHDGQCASQGFSGFSTAPWHRRYAKEIRGLPLPGDVP